MLELLFYSFLEARWPPRVLAHLTAWTAAAAPPLVLSPSPLPSLHSWEMEAHSRSITMLSPYHVPNTSNTYIWLPFLFITGRRGSITVSICPHCKDGKLRLRTGNGLLETKSKSVAGLGPEPWCPTPVPSKYAASAFHAFALDISPAWGSFPCYSNSVST